MVTVSVVLEAQQVCASISLLDLSFVIRMDKASQSKECKVQTLATIGNALFSNFDLTFLQSLVMHHHSGRILHRWSPNVITLTNNPVSGKERNKLKSWCSMIIQETMVIAHARMRTPTEELEYVCLAWFHLSTLSSINNPLFFSYSNVYPAF